MKKTIIGEILAIVSSIWAIAIGAYVQMNLVSSWSSSRFWSSALELGVVVPLTIALTILALSIVIIAIEYFRKER